MFWKYLLQPLKQHFVDQPVQYTPVIISAENDNLPVHLPVDLLPTNTSPEPVSQYALSECLAHSDLLPKITPPPQNNFAGNSPKPTP